MNFFFIPLTVVSLTFTSSAQDIQDNGDVKQGEKNVLSQAKLQSLQKFLKENPPPLSNATLQGNWPTIEKDGKQVTVSAQEYIKHQLKGKTSKYALIGVPDG